MKNQNPEQLARDIIDRRLAESGWKVQSSKTIDWSAGLGIAIKEYQTEVGPADYVLFVDRTPVGVIEAKKDDEGHRLTAVEDQSRGYADSKLKYIDNQPLPFRYESTGVLTRFTDARDPKPRSRSVFSFHRPETLLAYIEEEGGSFRARLQNLPSLPTAGLRDCQINAITNLEQSFKDAKPRALVQMATGSGKTFTAITSVYRLLKFAKAKRILFLVDTKNLGEQAEQEFMSYVPVDDPRKFTELYNVTRLKSGFIPPDSQVYISTIQRLYSVLKGREMDEHAEDQNPNESTAPQKEPFDVVYNQKVPLEFFDVIIVDECHRSIYNLWKQVLDYFDAFLIGLTATPDKRTFGFFQENIVSEYSHAQAVADGVNVGFDLFVIETKITKNGAQIEAKEYVDRRERLTRKTRWEQVDEDELYSAKDLDRDYVNPSQIRNVINTFKKKLPTIFPNRKEIPKTLIFAKTDSHADDIIQIVREEFGEGNDFCKKITYQAEEDPKSVLAQFRNGFNPRIAVTVDMIATGTDIRPLECLLFMRDVKSKNYYEQMLGRGTRTFDEDNLKKVTPSATNGKTHFVVIDAIGVTKSHKTDARPLEKKPTVPLKDLLNSVLMGSQDEEVYSSLAGRLARLEKTLTEEEKREVKNLAKGQDLKTIVKALMNAHDPDVISDRVKASGKAESEVKELLIREASGMLSGPLNAHLENARKVHDQTIDRVNIDEVLTADWGTDHGAKQRALVTDFEAYLNEHKNEIMALTILYNEPQRRKEITYAMISELLAKLKANRPNLAPVRVYEAYASLDNVRLGSPKSELTAIVSLVRRASGIDQVIGDYDQTVYKNFQDWVFRKQSGKVKFSKEQMEWLHMIRDHVASSFHIERDDLDFTPFDARGGLAKMYELFGPQMDNLIIEMNEALVA